MVFMICLVKVFDFLSVVVVLFGLNIGMCCVCNVLVIFVMSGVLGFMMISLILLFVVYLVISLLLERLSLIVFMFGLVVIFMLFGVVVSLWFVFLCSSVVMIVCFWVLELSMRIFI